MGPGLPWQPLPRAAPPEGHTGWTCSVLGLLPCLLLTVFLPVSQRGSVGPQAVSLQSSAHPPALGWPRVAVVTSYHLDLGPVRLRARWGRQLTRVPCLSTAIAGGCEALACRELGSAPGPWGWLGRAEGEGVSVWRPKPGRELGEAGPPGPGLASSPQRRAEAGTGVGSIAGLAP